jgi:hypothetical protein
MSLQNEMRRVRLTNLEHIVRKLRLEIASLCKIICINLDLGLFSKPDDLPIAETDSQWDELKSKWAELIAHKEEIKRLEEELK